MKKFVFLFCLLFMFNSFVLAGDRYVYTKGGPDKNFSIDIPENWKVDDTGQSTSPLILWGPSDMGFNININVVIEKSGDTGMKAYVAKILSFKSDTVKEIKALSGQDITVNGQKAYQTVVEYTFSYQGSNFSSKTLQTIILNNGYAFIITGSANKDTFDKYKDIFIKISGTFKLGE